jgi:hypothetical protein
MIIQKQWYSCKDPSGMDYDEQMMRQITSEDPLIPPIGIHKPWNDHVK